MDHRNRLGAYKIYLILEGTVALLFAMIFTASAIYQVTTARLTPLQLVLVGTTLEGTIFLFEVPTGVVADVYSRRLSIIIGYFLIGAGFVLEGSIPVFWSIVLAQVLWGAGYTFTSGATQAWITDEIGETEANRAFLRANQVRNAAGLVGIGLGAWIGSWQINLPIQLGGLLLAGLGVFLILFMPETGFKPIPKEERNTWKNLADTFIQGVKTVRGRPELVMILGIGLIYGLYSEGYDRLWTKHLLENIGLPDKPHLTAVAWTGMMDAAGSLLSISLVEAVRRKVDTSSSKGSARALLVITILLMAGLFGFALAKGFVMAVLAFWLIGMARNLIGPIYTAWVNQRLESRVRATVLSMSSQVDAIGQITSGPVMGLVGSAVSTQAALLVSGGILTPAVGLLGKRVLKADEMDTSKNHEMQPGSR